MRPYTRVWSEANISSSRPTRDLALAVRASAPFALNFTQERVEVTAGQKADLKLHLQRHWKDFSGKVTILPLALPDALRMANAEIAAGGEEATLTVEAPANAAPGEYTITVLGQAQTPYSKDAQAASKPNVLVSLPARPLTLVVLPKK